MFTPKNIQGALEELYDLCDPDYMVDMLVNYSEEFDDISPALLAKSFQKNAEMISEYRVLSSAGEGIDYQGKVLLNSRAVRLLSYVEDMSGDEKVRTIQSKELWLAEDMTFYVVSCMSTITMDKEEAICLKDGLQPIEKTVIDRCVHQIYQRYFDNPAPENMPILEDLYDALLKQDEKEAHHVATALEIYVKGSLKLFNNRTNVDIQNRLVCFDIKELGNQLKKIGMLIVQDQVWGRVTANRSAGKSTRYYIDEFHLLLKEEQTATYSVEIWKRFRKWGGLPTGITQNVKDLLRSPEIANILENSDFIYMLNQASDDRSILAQRLNISPHQLSYVTNSGEGEGLLFYGNVILPFIDRFPTDLELYRIMTTKLNEVAQEKEAYDPEFEDDDEDSSVDEDDNEPV